MFRDGEGNRLAGHLALEPLSLARLALAAEHRLSICTQGQALHRSLRFFSTIRPYMLLWDVGHSSFISASNRGPSTQALVLLGGVTQGCVAEAKYEREHGGKIRIMLFSGWAGLFKFTCCTVKLNMGSPSALAKPATRACCCECRSCNHVAIQSEATILVYSLHAV